MKRLVLVMIPALFCGMMFTGCGYKMDEEVDNMISKDPNYPTTINRLSEETLLQMRSHYAQRNPFVQSTIDQFGFCATENVEAMDAPSGSLTREEAIAAVKNFVARNPDNTGISNFDDLYFDQIETCTHYNNVYWHFCAKQKNINNIEMYGTGIVFHIINKAVYLCCGNHFPNVYVPKKFNFEIERAKSKLLGKEVIHLGWAGEYSLGKIKTEHLQESVTNLIVIPLKTEEKIELRVAWKIYLASLHYIFYVDVMTGEIIQEEPTIIH